MTTKRLVTNAMLIAMYVVLSTFATLPLGNIRITLAGLPIIVGAALFGPLDGLIIGLMGGFINQLLTYGLTYTTVLWIIPAGVRGLIVGLYSKKHGFAMTQKQSIFIVVLSSLVVTTLNTGVLYIDSIINHYFSKILILGDLAQRYIVGALTALVMATILPPLLRIVREKRATGSESSTDNQ